jgi:hypothetical protein
MCGLPCVAAADPISIGVAVSSGTIFVGQDSVNGASYNITGPEFSFQGESGAVLDTAHFCGPCLPGQTISFSGFLPGSFHGPFTFQGRTFELNSSNNGGALFLNAPAFVLPPSGPGRISFTTPFSLGGSILVDEGFGDAFE